jgi:hypothetical protein
MEKNKKLIIILASVFLIIIGITLVLVMVSNKKNTPLSKEIVKKEVAKKPQIIKKGTQPIPLTEEKKLELSVIKKINGKISFINAENIKIITDSGEELVLSIPKEGGASFAIQTIKESGVFSIREVGVFEIPINKTSSIQYNSSNNEVMLVVVK